MLMAQSLLFGVTARDPLVFVAVPVILAAVAADRDVWLSGAARRRGYDPIVALRCDGDTNRGVALLGGVNAGAPYVAIAAIDPIERAAESDGTVILQHAYSSPSAARGRAAT